MSNKLKLAQTLAAYAHEGQKYGNMDYYETHIIDVVQRVGMKISQLSESEQEDYLIAAYLHDTCEDSTVTVDTIWNLFGEEVVEAVCLLSKSYLWTTPDGDITKCIMPKEKYLQQIKLNKVSKLVKICDTESNLDASIADSNQKRIDKYRKQLEELLK